MADFKAHKVLTSLPGSLEADSVYFLKDGNGIKCYVTNNSGLVVPYPLIDAIRPIVFSQSGITIHNGVGNNETTNAVTTNITLDYAGDYLLTLSFNYNVDATNVYGKYYATFNGSALDLNDRSGDPQGVNQILVVEMKDAGNSSSGPITGTGSGNKATYQMQFLLSGQVAGTYPLVIDVGCQTAGINASIWNIVAKFELITIATALPLNIEASAFTKQTSQTKNHKTENLKTIFLGFWQKIKKFFTFK